MNTTPDTCHLRPVSIPSGELAPATPNAAPYGLDGEAASLVCPARLPILALVNSVANWRDWSVSGSIRGRAFHSSHTLQYLIEGHLYSNPSSAPVRIQQVLLCLAAPGHRFNCNAPEREKATNARSRSTLKPRFRSPKLYTHSSTIRSCDSPTTRAPAVPSNSNASASPPRPLRNRDARPGSRKTTSRPTSCGTLGPVFCALVACGASTLGGFWCPCPFEGCAKDVAQAGGCQRRCGDKHLG